MYSEGVAKAGGIASNLHHMAQYEVKPFLKPQPETSVTLAFGTAEPAKLVSSKRLNASRGSAQHADILIYSFDFLDPEDTCGCPGQAVEPQESGGPSKVPCPGKVAAAAADFYCSVSFKGCCLGLDPSLAGTLHILLLS
jgi:hypothetical protein